MTPFEWTLAHFPAEQSADFSNWIPSPGAEYRPVAVPGAVQVSDYGIAYPDILLRRNWEQVEWMEHRLWVYHCRLPELVLEDGRVGLLRFRGLDYRARIFVNGQLAVDHEGMYAPVEIEIAAELARRGAEIHVAFLPPAWLPRGGGVSADSVNATASGGIPHLKARFMEGWDFTPRLRCIGIWDDVEYFAASIQRFTGVTVQTRRENAGRAEVAVTARLNRVIPLATLRAELDGETLEVPINGRDRASIVLTVRHPRWWQPHTHGSPERYELALTLLDSAGAILHASIRQIGLREVARIPARNQRPTDTPLQLTINGQPVFLNGANLTPFSAVPGQLTEADYRRVLEPLREANVNFLRVWGGGIREKECFYRLCDELGFLVMQEFPLACQKISRDPAYLALLEREARAMVRALSAHPCVIWWTGGNEHYHFWEALDSGSERMEAIKDHLRGVFEIAPDDRTWRGGEDPNHPALRLLHGIIQEEVPSLPYQVTSGLEDQGDTHGPWNLRLEISDHRFRDLEFFDFWRTSRSNLYSEASVAAAANGTVFERVLQKPLADLAIPPDRDDADWIAHKAFRAAWDRHSDLWLDIPETESWFGPLATLPELIFANQYLQCEATRFMIEAVRRRQGETTGLVWWGINEPFPSLAGNALVGFFGDRKPALRTMGAAFQPLLLSLAYEKCVQRKVRGEVHFTNSLPAEFRGKYEVEVAEESTGEVIDRFAGDILAPGYASVRLMNLTPLTVPAARSVIVRLRFRDAAGRLGAGQIYRFFAAGSPAPLRPLLARAHESPDRLLLG